MNTNFLNAVLRGDNYPPCGNLEYESSDHVRYQNGVDVSGHNYGCHRKFVIEKNISGNEGYTVSIINQDGLLFGSKYQMAPKQMRIVNVDGDMVEFRGYGYDENALAMGVSPQMASFADYGVSVRISEGEITYAKLYLFDRNVTLVYYR